MNLALVRVEDAHGDGGPGRWRAGLPRDRLASQHDRDLNHGKGLRGHQGNAAGGCGLLANPADGLGGVRIWLEHKFVDRLRALRSPGESYSDVIIRLAEEEDDSEE
jgi:hypothetical protein